MSGPAGAQIRLRGRRGAAALDVALDLAVGVTALSGPSGAGKSTLLRAVAGLERLDGEVRVAGQVWQDGASFRPPHRRAVGYAPQHAALLPHLSVAGNLDYGGRRAGGAAHDRAQVVDLLGLAPLLDRSPRKLSGGERQRVCIGRALLTRPDLLLLDEPLTGLDPAAKADLIPRLAEALAALAIPVVYVSHDADEALRMARTALVLRDGRVTTAPVAPPLAGRSREDIERLARLALGAGLAL